MVTTNTMIFDKCHIGFFEPEACSRGRNWACAVRRALLNGGLRLAPLDPPESASSLNASVYVGMLCVGGPLASPVTMAEMAQRGPYWACGRGGQEVEESGVRRHARACGPVLQAPRGGASFWLAGR